ncbi:MAG: SLOG family protein [Eubacteriales bacterium]
MSVFHKLYEDGRISYPEKERCCFFTGHRDYIMTAQNVELLRGAIDSAIKDGCDIFYAGGALGFDTCAEIMTSNLRYMYSHIELNLALPFFGYSHNGSQRDRELFRSILSRCDNVYYMLPSYSYEGYHMRNRFMADRSCRCIAYLAHAGGGTASAVRYALSAGCSTINLYTPGSGAER